MMDASVGAREQLLPEQADRQDHAASEQLKTSDMNLTEDMLVDDMASTKHPRLSPQPFSGSKTPGWPDRPLSLTQTHRVISLSTALDSILLIVALLFLALAAGAVAVSGRRVGDQHGELIEEATRLGPTVFPIVFAALVGRALKAIGRFKSEKGTKFSTLWAFLSTKTVFDAVLLQWSAGALSLPTILMGLLWALSPAGGQASLRMLYRTNQTSVSSTSIHYMDTGPLGILYTYATLFEGYDMGPNATNFPFPITAPFAAAMMQDFETKSGPRDSWGSPKVPRLDMLNHSSADENGWIEVSQTTTVELFSSLFGLPLLGVPDQGTVEFEIESAYVQLGKVSVEQDPIRSGGGFDLEVTCPTCVKDYRRNHDRIALLMGPPWEQPNSTQLAQESVTKASLVRFEQSHFWTNLSAELTQVLVETHIVCEEGICRATKVRPSTRDHRPQNITAFDLWGTLALDILNQFNGQGTWSPTMLELFMNKTSTVPVYRANAYTLGAGYDWVYTNLARREPQILSSRATLLLNTAMHLLYSYYGFAGDLPSVEAADWGPPHIPADGLDAAAAAYNVTPEGSIYHASTYVTSIVNGSAAFVAASTEASVTRNNNIYKVNYAYVTVLVISALTLAIIGTVGMVTGLRTRGPDVFDPLMGLTYNNDSLGLPSPGSTLDTDTRAKLLRDMRVRLGDVAGGESVGMVGVGRTSEVRPLTKGRLYE